MNISFHRSLNCLICRLGTLAIASADFNPTSALDWSVNCIRLYLDDANAFDLAEVIHRAYIECENLRIRLQAFGIPF